jgi:hypothetical protein
MADNRGGVATKLSCILIYGELKPHIYRSRTQDAFLRIQRKNHIHMWAPPIIC